MYAWTEKSCFTVGDNCFIPKKKNQLKPNQKKQIDILMDWTEERIPELSGMSSGLANSR